MEDPLLFSLAALAILGTPGPTNTLLAASGALVGVRRSLPLIAAEQAGYLLAIIALHAALGSLLAAHPALDAALRAALGAYLLATAWSLWRRGTLPQGQGRPIGLPRVFVTTLLNPKALVFAFAVIPLSAPAAGLYLLAFAAFVAAAAFGWIAAGASAGRLAGPASRLVPRAAAFVLACFAGLTAVGG